MRTLARKETFLIAKPERPLTFQHAASMRQAMDKLCDIEGIREIAIDLSEISEVDASGLGALVAMSTDSRAKSRKMYIFKPSETVSKMMQQLEIDGFFPLIEHVESLLGHLPE